VKALVIIDMQMRFDAAHCRITLRNILREVDKFKAQNLPIILVEYRAWGHGAYTAKDSFSLLGHSPTRPEITNRLIGYQNCFTVLKSRDNGGDEVHLMLVENLDLVDELYCCGVNTGYCVHDTALQLLDYGYAVRILSDCCNHIYKNRDCKAAQKENGQYFEIFEENGIDVIPSYTN
jgi:nicotinamidase-related amidase